MSWGLSALWSSGATAAAPAYASPPVKDVACTTCSGVGTQTTYANCASCKGTGGFYNGSQVVPCANCRGLKTISTLIVCQTCRGTRSVKQQAAFQQCVAVTLTGTQCLHAVTSGSQYCGQHVARMKAAAEKKAEDDAAAKYAEQKAAARAAAAAAAASKLYPAPAGSGYPGYGAGYPYGAGSSYGAAVSYVGSAAAPAPTQYCEAITEAGKPCPYKATKNYFCGTHYGIPMVIGEWVYAADGTKKPRCDSILKTGDHKGTRCLNPVAADRQYHCNVH